MSDEVWIELRGLLIRCTPTTVTVPYEEDLGEGCVNDSWVDTAGWQASCCGIKALALTPQDAARMVREQLA